MKKLTLIAAGIGLAGIAAAQAIGGDWALTWADNFDAGPSDLNGWTYDLGNNNGWGNNEREVYTNSSSNVSVSGGYLNIDAIATGTGSNQTYTSGRIRTNNLFSQAYGLFEFRAKLPQGRGLWPALWMMPRDSIYGGWPNSGEIDVLESKGQNPDLVQGSLHSGTSSNTQDTQTRTFAQSGFEPQGFTTGVFHVYDLRWDRGSPGVPGTISWYVDGVRYSSFSGGWVIPGSAGQSNKDAPFDQPFYIIINLAVGGTYVGNPNLAPGTYGMQVDYVRAYTPLRPVSGTVNLQSYLGPVAGMPVVVEIRTVGTTTDVDSQTTTLDGSGNFTIKTAVQPGNYDMAVKAPHWLRQSLSNRTLSESGLAGLSYSLFNGDINGDNVVSLSDFAALRAAFGSSAGSGNWNPNADLNGDGVVSLGDFAILRANFGKQGDP